MIREGGQGSGGSGVWMIREGGKGTGKGLDDKAGAWQREWEGL